MRLSVVMHASNICSLSDSHACLARAQAPGSGTGNSQVMSRTSGLMVDRPRAYLSPAIGNPQLELFRCSSSSRARSIALKTYSKLVAASAADLTVEDAKIVELKSALLYRVAPLDRGVAATQDERVLVEEAAGELETAFKADSETSIDVQLNGNWRLIYSSTFAGQGGGTQGFTGSPTGGGPLQLGQVYQRIQAAKKKVDNIVEISTPQVWLVPPVKVTATLAHTSMVLGPKTLQITFEDLTVRVGGALRGVRPLTPPQLPDILRPPPALRSGSFCTTFVDEELRVSRGDRGELRIFVKADITSDDEE